MDWKDPATGEVTRGFREMGFLPDAFINMLALLGWNDGSEQEIFTKEELIAAFSMERVHKGGAKFNFEKAKWFNHEWIKKTPDVVIAGWLKEQLNTPFEEEKIKKIVSLIKDRCTLLSDVWANSYFFFVTPEDVDVDSIRPKWNSEKRNFFAQLTAQLTITNNWNAHDLENTFKELTASMNIKAGDVLLPLRIMLVGKKIGPGVFDIAEVIGKEETLKRIAFTLDRL
jgi:glutamyl-tRNA synthetase